MTAPKVNANKLKQAVEEFGSLQKAVGTLQKDEKALGKQNAELKLSIAKLEQKREKLLSEVADLESKQGHHRERLHLLVDTIRQYGRQYHLFESFLAMVAASPSVTSSVEVLIESFQRLMGSGWHTWKDSEDLRTLFVRTVFGDFLRCFRCDSYGARFMVNREPRYQYFQNYYVCPACHYKLGVKPDDSLLKAIVSEEQLENICRVEELQKENEALKPVKVFLNLPCEVCGQPVTEWTEQDVKRGVSGLGWGHTACWNTDKGQIKQFFKLFKEELERRTHGSFS